MMEAVVIVEQVQKHFIDQFQIFVTHQLENCEKCSQEVKFEVPTEGIYSGLYCVDFIINENGVSPVPFIPENVLEFPLSQYQSGNLSLTIKEMRWDRVLIETNVEEIPESAISGWFDYWFDLNDQRLQDQPTFGNIVHSVSIDGNTLNIDFGSAEPKAFWELMTSLEKAGATEALVRYGE